MSHECPSDLTSHGLPRIEPQLLHNRQGTSHDETREEAATQITSAAHHPDQTLNLLHMQERADRMLNSQHVTQVLKSIASTEKNNIVVETALQEMKSQPYLQKLDQIRRVIDTEESDERETGRLRHPFPSAAVISPQPRKTLNWDKTEVFKGGGKIAIQKRQKQFNFLNATLLNTTFDGASRKPIKYDNGDIDFCIKKKKFTRSPKTTTQAESLAIQSSREDLKANLVTLELPRPKKQNIIVPASVLMNRKQSSNLTVYNSHRELQQVTEVLEPATVQEAQHQLTQNSDNSEADAVLIKKEPQQITFSEKSAQPVYASPIVMAALAALMSEESLAQKPPSALKTHGILKQFLLATKYTGQTGKQLILKTKRPYQKFKSATQVQMQTSSLTPQSLTTENVKIQKNYSRQPTLPIKQIDCTSPSAEPTTAQKPLSELALVQVGDHSVAFKHQRKKLLPVLVKRKPQVYKRRNDQVSKSIQQKKEIGLDFNPSCEQRQSMNKTFMSPRLPSLRASKKAFLLTIPELTFTDNQTMPTTLKDFETVISRKPFVDPLQDTSKFLSPKRTTFYKKPQRPKAHTSLTLVTHGMTLYTS